MPKVKKTTTRTVKAAKPAARARKSTKGQDQSVQLHKDFIDSLKKLTAYWDKLAIKAAKSVEKSRTQTKKAQEKLKTLKAQKKEHAAQVKVSSTAKDKRQLEKTKLALGKQQSIVDDLKQSFASMKQEQQHAKNQITLYRALKKSIDAIMSESQAVEAETPPKTVAKAKKSSEQAQKTPTPKTKKVVKAKKKTSKKKAPVAVSKSKERSPEPIVTPEISSQNQIEDIFEEQPNFDEVFDDGMKEDGVHQQEVFEDHLEEVFEEEASA